MNRSRAWSIALVVLIGLALARFSLRVPSRTPCEPPPPDGPGVSRVDLGARVLNVAAGPKGLWAIRQPDVTKQGSELVELDPATGKIKGRPVVLPANGWPLDVGHDAVWVVTSRITAHPRGILHRVDPESHRIVASLRTGLGTSSISVGEGGVWVANRAANTVLQVDPSGRRVLKTVRVEYGPDLVLARSGAVWVGGGEVVHRIDTATGRSTGSMEGTLGNVGAGGVWVIRNGPPNGQILQIDPATLRPVGPMLGLDILPAAVGIAGRDLWVGKYFQYCDPTNRGGRPGFGSNPLSLGWFRVDPVTLKPLSGPVYVGPNPRTPVFAAGAFWIWPDYPGNELIRIDLATAAKVRRPPEPVVTPSS